MSVEPTLTQISLPVSRNRRPWFDSGLERPLSAISRYGRFWPIAVDRAGPLSTESV